MQNKSKIGFGEVSVRKHRFKKAQNLHFPNGVQSMVFVKNFKDFCIFCFNAKWIKKIVW